MRLVGSLLQNAPITILNIGDIQCHNPKIVGSKAANLSLLAEYHRVPPGFVITADAFQSIDSEDILPTDSGSSNTHGMPGSLYRDFKRAYYKLGLNSSTNEFAVAVRSSALDEDGVSASFAGQHLTYLNVVGEFAVVDAIMDCWQSVLSPSALEYRRHHGIELYSLGMAVIIQEMVRADVSAVVFSANPTTADKGEILINSTWGLCESIVSGMSTPDSYVIRKDTKRLINSDISQKTTMTVPIEDGIEMVDVPTKLQYQPSLTSDQLTEIANIAVSLESRMGCPVDIEFSYYRDNLYLLQCRPITGMR